jgi:hypothetical protein
VPQTTAAAGRAGPPNASTGKPPGAGHGAAAAAAPRPDRVAEISEVGALLPAATSALRGIIEESPRRSWLRGVMASPLTRFVSCFAVGVGSTLAWQSYSDAGREAAARWCTAIAAQAVPVIPVPAPEPGKVAVPPRLHEASAAAGGAAPDPGVAAAPEQHSSDPLQSASDLLKSTSQALAGVRDSMDRLTSELTRLQTTADRGAPDRATSAMVSGQPPASKPPSRAGH